MESSTRPAISHEEARRLYGNRSVALGYLNIALASTLTLAVLWFADPTPLLLAIGVPLILLGEGWHTWAHGHLLKNLELVTSGPYAHVQNPLYLGRFLMAVGLLIAVGLPLGASAALALLLAGVFFGYYMPRKTRVEGKRLKGFHGEAWEDYRRSVPRLVPSFRRYPRGDRRRISWSRLVASREYFVWLALAGALAVLTVKAFP